MLQIKAFAQELVCKTLTKYAQHNKIVHKTFCMAKFCMLYIFIVDIAYSLTFDRFLLAGEEDSALKDTMWCWRKNDDSHYRVK